MPRVPHRSLAESFISRPKSAKFATKQSENASVSWEPAANSRLSEEYDVFVEWLLGINPEFRVGLRTEQVSGSLDGFGMEGGYMNLPQGADRDISVVVMALAEWDGYSKARQKAIYLGWQQSWKLTRYAVGLSTNCNEIKVGMRL